MYFGVDVDLVTGAGRLSIGTSEGRADIGVYNAQVGIPVALSQITQDIVGTVTNFVKGTVGAVVSGLSQIKVAPMKVSVRALGDVMKKQILNSTPLGLPVSQKRSGGKKLRNASKETAKGLKST